MEKVGKVGRLLIFPVKSMGGIEVTELECTISNLKYGEFGDRQWAVMNRAGMGLDGRMQPRLVLIKPSFHGDMLHLDADGMPTLKVPSSIPKDGGEIRMLKFPFLDAEGVDCGDEAARWLSKFMDKEGLRLVYAAPGLKRRKLKDDERSAPTFSEEDVIIYQDISPGLLIGDASIQDLNSRLKKPVDAFWFRPNIIATDTAGPYVEDDWKQINIGATDLTVPSLLPRCIFTTVDPLTGKKDPDKEPWRTLQTYRVKPLAPGFHDFAESPSLGLMLCVQKPGMIRVGDPIMAMKSAAP